MRSPKPYCGRVQYFTLETPYVVPVYTLLWVCLEIYNLMVGVSYTLLWVCLYLNVGVSYTLLWVCLIPYYEFALYLIMGLPYTLLWACPITYCGRVL